MKEKEEEEDAEKAVKGEFIEEEPSGLVSGIKIKRLSKVGAWLGGRVWSDCNLSHQD